MRSQICCGAMEPRSANALTPMHASGVIAERDGAVLRHASDEDLPAVDSLTVVCYRPIWESYVAMLGEECYAAVRHDPELTWEERKIRQNRELFAKHPEWLWVLADRDGVFGFVSFWLVAEKNYGHIDNNGVSPERAGQGWATFMYRHVLQHFRDAGLRFAHVDTGLDDAHIPARRAYEAVGFDRAVPTVEYWRDLSRPDAASQPR
jgi:ribosomal protein S18 acetylase RimI-like enzyme